MKKYFPLAISCFLLLLNPAITKGTNDSLVDFCGFDKLYNWNIQNTPNFLSQRLAFDNDIRATISSMGQNQGFGVTPACPQNMIIPVVVHVIYPTGQPVGQGSNISYEQIVSQIAALNAGFNNAYPNYNGQVPSGLATSTGIRFVLATIPSGPANWTNVNEPGVMRWATNNAAILDGIQAAPSNQNTNWSPLKNLTHPTAAYFPFDKYLNIWLVRDIDADARPCDASTVGFAFIPNTANTFNILDGVVFRSDCFGDNSIPGNHFPLYQRYPVFDQGKVLVHEVGHYFDMLHTFHPNGSGGTICAGTTGFNIGADPCNINGDRMCDVPPCYFTQPFSCASTVSACGAFNDPNENYMSYANDDCLNTFTSDQKNWMLAVLNNAAKNRFSLWQIANLNGTGVNNHKGECVGAYYIQHTPFHPCPNTNITFNSLTTACSECATSFNWQFPGSNTPVSNQRNPVGIAYPAQGDYTVTLTLSDGIVQAIYTTTIHVANWNANLINASPVTTCDNALNTLEFQITGGTPPYNITLSNGVNFVKNIDRFNYTLNVPNTTNISIAQVTGEGCNAVVAGNVQYNVQKCCQEQIANGNFTDQSTYNYFTSDLVPGSGRCYYYSNNGSVFQSFGGLLYLDGPYPLHGMNAINPTFSNIWMSTPIVLNNGTNYEASFLVTNTNNTCYYDYGSQSLNQPLNLQFLILDNAQNIVWNSGVLQPLTAQDINNVQGYEFWCQFKNQINFNLPTGNYNLCIRQVNNFGPTYYDYAIDEITLRPVSNFSHPNLTTTNYVKCPNTPGVSIGYATAQPNYSYTWAPATGLSCTTCANPTANPATTTIYTLTINGTGTDNCGTSVQNVTVSVQNVATTITVSSSQAVVNQNDMTFTLTVCNNSNQAQSITITDNLPTGMTVINANGFTVNGLQLTRNVNISANTCIPYTFVARPTLTFSGSSQCAYQSTPSPLTNSASAQPSGCSAVNTSNLFAVFSHRVVGSNLSSLLPSGVSLASVSGALQQGMILPVTSSAITAQTVTIDGAFSIDQNYRFDRTVSGNVRSNIWCKPVASITVNSNITFTANYTNFTACTNMWKGIIVQGGALPPPAGTLVMDNSIVADALYGLLLFNQSRIGVTNTQFLECFVGVYFSGGVGQTIVPTTPFSNNYFTSYGNMKPITGMTPDGSQPPLSQVTASRRTWAGMHLRGGVTFAITGNPSSFFGVANGIIAIDCDLNVQGTAFSAVNAYGYNFNSMQGNGIYCQRTILTSNGTLYQRGLGLASAVTFTNCDRAIITNKTNVDIGSNMATGCTNGFQVTAATNGSIKINNNKLTTANTAIALYNNDPLNNSEISYNDIICSGGTAAIDVQGQNIVPNPTQVVNFHHNKVTMTGVLFGVNFNSCSGDGSGTYTYKIYNNTVIVSSAGAAFAYSCISFSNCHKMESSNNLITGTSGTYQSIFGTGTPLGIQYSASDGNFTCDKVATIYTGIRFLGTCNTFPGTVLKTAEMNTNSYGLHITSSATLSNIGSSTTSNANKWTGSFAVNSARSEQSVLTPIFVNGTSIPYYAPAVATVFPGPSWFQPSSGAPVPCTSSVGAGYKNNEDGTSQLTELDEQIINDSLHFTEFEAELKWQNEKIVFEKLKENSDLIEPGTETEAFFQAKSNSPTGALSNVEDSKSDAMQPEISQVVQLNQLQSQKENLTLQLLAADTLVDSNSTTIQYASWAAITNSVRQSIETVNSQITALNESINVDRLQKLQEASSSNSNITVELQIENNQKLLNDVYFNTAAIGVDTFTAPQLTTLYYLAFQCPLSGGSAVYRSRSLLSKIIDTFYNDHEICAAAGIAYKKEQETKAAAKDTAITLNKIKVSAFPNPANSYLLLQSNNPSDEIFAVKVYDNIGRIVKEERASFSTRRFRLETQNLSSGLYFLKLSNSSQFSYSTKFNVQH